MTNVASYLLWPCALFAVGAAVYTAFLFAQAKGRDFWQNPLLPLHLLSHAMLAGSAVWLLYDVVSGVDYATARTVTVCALIFSLVALLAEMMTTPPTVDAHRALRWIVADPMLFFWIFPVGFGHLVPLFGLLTTEGNNSLHRLGVGCAAFLILSFLAWLEALWVLAPQKISLS
jgi:formate-dependent nitrite reductase membrane component NrfD